MSTETENYAAGISLTQSAQLLVWQLQGPISTMSFCSSVGISGPVTSPVQELTS